MRTNHLFLILLLLHAKYAFCVHKCYTCSRTFRSGAKLKAHENDTRDACYTNRQIERSQQNRIFQKQMNNDFASTSHSSSHRWSTTHSPLVAQAITGTMSVMSRDILPSSMKQNRSHVSATKSTSRTRFHQENMRSQQKYAEALQMQKMKSEWYSFLNSQVAGPMVDDKRYATTAATTTKQANINALYQQQNSHSYQQSSPGYQSQSNYGWQWQCSTCGAINPAEMIRCEYCNPNKSTRHS